MGIPKPNMPNFNPPVYYCNKATEKLTPDGRLDKSFWENAPFTDYFVDIEGAHMAKPKYNTRAKMLWDDENLYIGAELEGDEIWATLTERDSVIFADNDFEIFINPSGDSHCYYEFEMNALNTVWDLLLTKSYLNGGYPVDAFDITGLQTVVYIDGELNNPSARNRKWSLEVVMPFSVLTQCRSPKTDKPVPGDFWRINFSRVQWDVDIVNNQYIKRVNPETGRPYSEHNWVYAAMGIVNIHYPELWGFLFFTEKGETYPVPKTESVRWELRKLYFNQHEYFDIHGRYADCFDDISDGYTYPVKPLVQATKHGFEISVEAECGEEVYIFADGLCKISGCKSES